MPDESQQTTTVVVPADSVGALVSDIVDVQTDAQTVEINQKLDEQTLALTTQLDTMSYEHQVNLETLATDTANATVQALKDANAQAEGEGTSQVVSIDASQWAFMQDSLRVSNTLAVFSMLVTCLVAGILLFNVFAGGWRH